MSASKLILYSSSHLAAFGFQASTLPDNITLNASNKKTDQIPSDFQTGISAAAHATLYIEQLISHTSGDIIPVSEVYELLTKVSDILDNTVFVIQL